MMQKVVSFQQTSLGITLLMAETQWQIKVVIRNFYSEILKGKRCLDQCGVGICFFFNNTVGIALVPVGH